MQTIVLLHGIPGSAATWGGVQARLASDFRVVAPNLIGFADRPHRGDVEALLAPSQARDVVGLLDRLGEERVVLVGHDFGGPVAAHVTALAPERVAALALFATNAFPDTPVPFPLSTITLPVVGGLSERLLFSRASLALMIRQGAGRPRPDLDIDAYLGPRSQQAAIRAIFGASLRRLRELYLPVERALREVRVPTIVGWGDRDPFFPVAVARRTAAAIAGAELRLYEGAGHFLPDERPDELAGDVAELARAVEGQPPAAVDPKPMN